MTAEPPSADRDVDRERPADQAARDVDRERPADHAAPGTGRLAVVR